MIKLDPQSRTAIVQIQNLSQLTKEGIEYASYTSAKGLQRSVNAAILQKPKGGRTYIRRDKIGRRRHVASAPGETHANMTGRLRRSLGFKVDPQQIEFGYGVNKNDAPEYAEFVELGTRKMKPRPSLLNGIKAERRNFQNNYEREIGKRLGDAVK